MQLHRYILISHFDLSIKCVYCIYIQATSAAHANIILWKEHVTGGNQTTTTTTTAAYKQFASLKGHELTITQMKFSNDSKYLLSVSRDRSWKLYKRTQEAAVAEEAISYELTRSIQSKNAFHTRIIWSCDWSHDDKYFVTTSRDKRVCIWTGDSDEAQQQMQEELPVTMKNGSRFLELSNSVTASSFAPCHTCDNK